MIDLIAYIELVFLCIAKYTIDPPSVILIAFKLKSLRFIIFYNFIDYWHLEMTNGFSSLNLIVSLFYLLIIFSLLLAWIGIFNIGGFLFSILFLQLLIKLFNFNCPFYTLLLPVMIFFLANGIYMISCEIFWMLFEKLDNWSSFRRANSTWFDLVRLCKLLSLSLSTLLNCIFVLTSFY